MNRLTWIFRGNHGWRAGWRFALFAAIYVFGGMALDSALERIHFPGHSFTWSGIFLNDLVDFAFILAIAWVMSRIERERFSSYGLPLVPNRWALLWKGAIWGFIPSVLILIPIYFTGGVTFHCLAFRGRAILFYTVAWALSMLVSSFRE